MNDRGGVRDGSDQARGARSGTGDDEHDGAGQGAVPLAADRNYQERTHNLVRMVKLLPAL
jgi:hypothetical protein